MNQLRANTKKTWRMILRCLKVGRKLSNLGSNCIIEQNVQFLRFPKNISVGSDVIIKEGVKICSCNPNATIQIGNRTTVGYSTLIFASERISIGSDCLIAPNVYIVDSNHRIDRGKKINEQQNETAPIVINNDVWVASGVTVLKGVIIGEGAVIAANSLVNKNIPPYEIWGGSPAKKIGERK